MRSRNVNTKKMHKKNLFLILFFKFLNDFLRKAEASFPLLPEIFRVFLRATKKNSMRKSYTSKIFNFSEPDFVSFIRTYLLAYLHLVLNDSCGREKNFSKLQKFVTHVITF